jgi:hypothetical protein
LPKNSTKFPVIVQIVSLLPLCHTLYPASSQLSQNGSAFLKNALYGLPEHWQSFTIFVIFPPSSQPVDVSYQQLLFVIPAYPMLRETLCVKPEWNRIAFFCELLAGMRYVLFLRRRLSSSLAKSELEFSSLPAIRKKKSLG